MPLEGTSGRNCTPGWSDRDFEQRCAAWVAEIRRRQHFDLRTWFTAGEEALREAAVVAQIRKINAKLRDRLRVEERAAESPGNVDAHNPHFVGRATELRRLRETVALSRVGILTAVHGLGGMGKTALAIEFAHTFAHEYGGGRWQVRCEGKDNLVAAIADLASSLGLAFTDGESHTLDRQFDRVVTELRARADASEPHRCLLILDNVDKPKLLDPVQTQRLPAADWLHVIATTRLAQQELSGAHKDRAFLPVDELPEGDALHLIEGYLPDGFRSDAERDAAQEIVRLLGGLTLAVESAAVYLGHFAADVTCGGFLARLEREGLESLDSAADQTAVGVRHGEKRVRATMQPTWERLGEREQLALTYAALLPADRISLHWIRALVSQRFKEFSTDAEPGYPDHWKSLLRLLSGLRLLQVTDIQLSWGRMHRVIQSVIKASVGWDVLNQLRGSLAEYLRTIQQDLERRIEMASPRHLTFVKISADQEDLRNELQFVLHAKVQQRRWHPKASEHHKALGAQEDYCDVYRFPCCGKYVVVGYGQPSQFRADGCEDAD
jgi:NB-ARC domain